MDETQNSNRAQEEKKALLIEVREDGIKGESSGCACSFSSLYQIKDLYWNTHPFMYFTGVQEGDLLVQPQLFSMK